MVASPPPVVSTVSPPPSPLPPSPPPPPPFGYVPAQGFESQLNQLCMTLCPIFPGSVARLDGPTGTAWRCYSPSTLTPDTSSYVSGSSFCTRDQQLRSALATYVASAMSPSPPSLPTPPSSPPSSCADDPTYRDVWTCVDWGGDGFPCRVGYGAINTQARIDALVAACPLSCSDVDCYPSPPPPSPPP